MPNPPMGLQSTENGRLIPWKGDLSGAGLVNSREFVLSSYTNTRLTMDGTAQSEALATGATKVKIGNLGATTEGIRYAFGESAAEAEANLNISTGAATTGEYIPPVADGGAAAFVVRGIPVNATHIAIANSEASDTQSVELAQGV